MKRYATPEIALQVGHEIQHLRLHRDIERGHGLVGDHQRRLQHQRARNRDALALPAGEHVRIARVVLGAQADLREHRARALARASASRASVLIASGASRMAPIFLRGLSEP